MFTISISPPDFAYVSLKDTYGGKQIHVQVNQEVIDVFRWFKEHKDLLDREQKLRESNPAVASIYEQYQTMMKLVMDDI